MTCYKVYYILYELFQSIIKTKNLVIKLSCACQKLKTIAHYQM